MNPTPLVSTVPEVSFRLEVPGTEGWTVLHLHATEGLSRPGEVSLLLATRNLSAAPDELFQKSALVELRRGHLLRNLRGLVRRVEDLGTTGHYRLARALIAPSLWLLSLRKDSRIFQGVNVPAIVQEVLRDAGLYQGDGELVIPPGIQSLPAREYCVQYRESDLDFVARLLEDEGIPFHFEYDGARESLVLVDESPSWHTAPTLDEADVRVLDGAISTAAAESVRSFDWRRETVSTSTALRDFDFTHPRAVLDMSPRAPASVGALPVYDFPAAFQLGAYDADASVYGPHHGSRAARVRHQEIQTAALTARGRGNCTGFAPGRAFTLRGHLRPELDTRYVLTSVEHVAMAWTDIPDELRSSERVRALLAELGAANPDSAAGTALHDRYENRFTCVPVTVPFRPARTTPRPSISGPQTAFVTAPAGMDEEIATDPHGRVLVRFHWERPELRTPTQRGRDSSCWVRVAQSWAGAGWGTLFIPRVGMEVVVHFLEGDPDRPLVTGSVYNGENRPPTSLPDEKTRSTVKTSSSRGGGGFNELRFDDLAGHEQIFVHAQRDHDVVVRRDQTLAVGHDRVKTIEGSEHVTVHRDRISSVEHNDALDVGGNHTVAIHGAAGASVRVDASYALHAQDCISLTVGDTSLVLLPDRATLSSRAVHVLGGELVNIYGGVTRINCEDGNRDFIRARVPMSPRTVGLQGNAGGSLRRTLVALEPTALVTFATKTLEQHMTVAAVPERLRARLTRTVSEGMGEWFQALRTGVVPAWVRETEGKVRELAREAVAKVFAGLETARAEARKIERKVREGLRDAENKIRDGVKDLENKVRTGLRDAENKIRDGVREVEGRVRDGVREVEGRVRDGVREVEGRVRDGVREVRAEATSLQRRLHDGLSKELQGAATEAVTSGVMHATALAREAARDPFWQALRQRDPAGATRMLTSVAKSAARQAVDSYARKHGVDDARDALASVLGGGVDRAVEEIGPQLLSALH